MRDLERHIAELLGDELLDISQQGAQSCLRCSSADGFTTERHVLMDSADNEGIATSQVNRLRSRPHVQVGALGTNLDDGSDLM